MAERIYTESDIQTLCQAEPELRALGLIVDQADGVAEYDPNLEGIRAFFDLNTQISVTVQSVVAAVEQMRDQMKWCSPAQLVAKQAGIDQHQADVLVTVLSRRDLDPDHIVDNAIKVAQHLLKNNWGWGPANIDLALAALGTSLRYKRRLQDNEKRALAEREAKSQPGEARISDDDVPKYVPAHLRDHWRKLHAGEKPETAPAAIQRSLYEKLSRDMVANMDVMDKSTAQAYLAKADAWGWEMVYRQLGVFSQRRRDDKAAAAQLARMGPR